MNLPICYSLNPVKTPYDNNSCNKTFLSPEICPGKLNNTYKKIQMLIFDLEIANDTIIKLHSELIQKDNELKILKFQKSLKNNQYQKTLKVIEEVLKQTKDIKNNENNNNNNILPPITKDNTYVYSLKQKINNLKEETKLKDDEINTLKKNTKSLNYLNLQNDFEINYKKLKNIKRQNELMKKNISNVRSLIKNEVKDNIRLNKKVHSFRSNFINYMDISDKRNSDLEIKLNEANDKEKECKIFHFHKGSSDLLLKKNKSCIEYEYDTLTEKTRLNEAEKEIKKLDDSIEKTQKELNSKICNYEDLNKKILGFKDEIKKLNKENETLKNKVFATNEVYKKSKEKWNNLNEENKELNNKFDLINNKSNKEKEKNKKIKGQLENKEKEINELKKQIENLKKNKNNAFVVDMDTKDNKVAEN